MSDKNTATATKSHGPEIVLTAEQMEAAQKNYQTQFMPKVHVIGRITMSVALVLAFLPCIYFWLVKGYTLPFSDYMNLFIAIFAIGIGMWLTEPLAYWPVLGSAGTYIAYLSGNVGGMRFPVALSVQSSLDADISKPRGQVATIVGIVASVFSNLIILLCIVLAGAGLLKLLEGTSILAAFGYVMPCAYGAMLMLRFNGKDGLVKGTIAGLPLLLTSVAVKLCITFIPALSFLSAYGTALATGATILVGYAIFKSRTGKAKTSV